MTGSTIQHYEVQTLLGQGGMGAVYKARDTRLNRHVAIKVLAPHAEMSAERKTRFFNEARAASSLNHPNIVTIHDILSDDGRDCIVMEYVDGRTLDHVIARKGLDPRTALRYAIQITGALSKAHAAGIVHRDIKPGNIMVDRDDRIKLLDFGLAKLVEDQPLGGAESKLETETIALTKEGAIVGTTAYMSPEQAEGKPVDARSDIFSFGAVLYEMVTGSRAFTGDTPLSVLSAIMREEPPKLSEVARGVPRELQRIIQRCLRKDPEQRFQSMRDIRLALEDLQQDVDSGIAGTPAGSKPARNYMTAGLLIGAIGAALSVWGVYRWTERRAPQPPLATTRLTFDSGLSDAPALSPDGKLMAYASDRAGENNFDLWIKQVPDGEPVRLTTQSVNEYDPVFSPDGTRIAYRSDEGGGGVYTIPALGGQSRMLAPQGRSPRYSPDGKLIVYRISNTAETGPGEVHVIPAAGGNPRRLHPGFITFYAPVWSPDGKHLLYWGVPNLEVPFTTADWYVAGLDDREPSGTGAAELFKQQSLSAGPPLQWIPAKNEVIFPAQSAGAWNIWKVRISPETRKASGPAEQVTFGADTIVSASMAANRLVFNRSIWNTDIWSAALDRTTGKASGQPVRLTQDAGDDILPYISADGKTVVYLSSRGHADSSALDVWVKRLPDGTETAVTSTADITFFPVLSHDGTKVVFGRVPKDQRKSSIFAKAVAGGSEEKLCDDCGQPRSWTPDGRYVIAQRPPQSLLLVDPAAHSSRRLVAQPPANLYAAHVSHDGHWIAFGARFKPGDERIFIAPFRDGAVPQTEAEWIAVTKGPALDNKPRWSVDGKLLYFTSNRDQFDCIWAQRLDPATKRPLGAPFAALHLHGGIRSFAATGGLKLELSVAVDKVVFHLDDIRGNIWLSEWRQD